MSEFDIPIPLRLDPESRQLDRQAVLPPDGLTVNYGMHGAVAEHYGAVPRNPLPSTLDYLVASIGGCLIGTFAGSLKRAKLPLTPADLTATATGHVSSGEDGVLVLRRVTVRYTLEMPEEHREAARAVHEAHAGRCPNARSVSPAIEVVTELEMVAPVAA